MRRKGVGGIPVVDDSGRAVGSIMIKDVKHLLTASENRDYRSDIDGLHGNIITFQKHCSTIEDPETMFKSTIIFNTEGLDT